MLNVGESKSGKTGALASLAKAGFHLYILDYDNGLDILRNVLGDDREALKRITYESPRDTIATVNGLPQLRPPIHAYKDAGKILQEWKIDTLGPDDILVLDTLTTFSEAAFNQAMMTAGRLTSDHNSKILGGWPTALNCSSK